MPIISTVEVSSYACHGAFAGYRRNRLCLLGNLADSLGEFLETGYLRNLRPFHWLPHRLCLRDSLWGEVLC
jgi:hypothetical protein